MRSSSLMCFITIELRRQCDRTVTRNCDAVTHNYEKKIVLTIQNSSLCFNPSQFFFIFGCSSNASASFYFVSLPPVDEQSSLNQNDFACSLYFLSIATHPHIREKAPYANPICSELTHPEISQKIFAK